MSETVEECPAEPFRDKRLGPAKERDLGVWGQSGTARVFTRGNLGRFGWQQLWSQLCGVPLCLSPNPPKDGLGDSP